MQFIVVWNCSCLWSLFLEALQERLLAATKV